MVILVTKYSKVLSAILEEVCRFFLPLTEDRLTRFDNTVLVGASIE